MVSSEMVQDTRKSYAWTRHVACEVAHIWKVARIFSDNSTERRADEARMPAASAVIACVRVCRTLGQLPSRIGELVHHSDCKTCPLRKAASSFRKACGCI